VFFDAGELESLFARRDEDRKSFFRKLIKI